jgi:AmmeMemoRadiSam system protein A
MTRAVALAEGALLAKLAAAAVSARLTGLDVDAIALPPILAEPGASFVTLERQGALRGCVGTLEAVRPLYDDVQRNAVRAMRDPRLPPVTTDDWPDLDVKVSVLTAPEPVPVSGRDELLAVLRPGIDGLIITDGARRATFLPAVWAKLPEPERFLDALLAKAGLTSWPDGLAVRRYESLEFRDPAPRAALVV